MTILCQRASAAMILLGVASAHAGPKETLLTSFESHGGNFPLGGVLFDAAGNLYGTTGRGGSANAGTVFELSPPASGHGAWTRTTLFVFNGADGQAPRGTLVFDAAGNIYGTTAIGGQSNMGTAYELSPPQPGKTAWHHTILTSFDKEAQYPYAGMVFDKAGNLFGTTLGNQGAGGSGLHGDAVYELSPPAQGKTKWTKRVLQRLGLTTGYASAAALVMDGSGNLYGTTQAGGGRANGGTVFEMSPPAAGSSDWKLTVLYKFGDEGGPYSSLSTLIFDAAGNLYGTSYDGGQYTYGTVFELSPPSARHSGWTPTLIWSFGNALDGQYPTEGNLVIGASGQIYGITYDGGRADGGLAFELTPPKKPGGVWKERELVSFTGLNGLAALGYLTTDQTGLLYGVTAAGGKGAKAGSEGYGAVFSLRP